MTTKTTTRVVSRGFGTTRVAVRTSQTTAPACASQRGYLREGLPAIYQDNDFGLRFVGALETVLDPVVSVLDSLHAYVEPDLAPADALRLLAGWLGLELDESWPEGRQRTQVRSGAELSRWAGTRRGIELALRIAFPDLPLRVEDNAKVTWAYDPDASADASATGFVVYCDAALADEQLASLDRMIVRIKPVHVPHRLRVRSAKRGAQ